MEKLLADRTRLEKECQQLSGTLAESQEQLNAFKSSSSAANTTSELFTKVKGAVMQAAPQQQLHTAGHQQFRPCTPMHAEAISSSTKGRPHMKAHRSTTHGSSPPTPQHPTPAVTLPPLHPAPTPRPSPPHAHSLHPLFIPPRPLAPLRPCPRPSLAPCRTLRTCSVPWMSGNRGQPCCRTR